ncbi:MAG: pyridoxamine 5'-phosphate oxidase family protein [Methanolinea sp.]|nr:pyridoxamine 5'-phosphate oxidase family protein [Methanolinea sp.]
MSSKLMEYFIKSPRIGSLSPAGKGGKVDSAVFGSPHMIDEKTVVMGLGKNRTLANLQENPYAVFLIMEPGETITDWKGVRVYLKRTDLATSGPLLDGLKSQLARVAGEAVANMMDAAVKFEIIEIRPLIDMGQGWEQSV